MKSDPGINLEFLAGGGAMGERIRAHPWAHTPLGEPQFWPRGLRTAVRVLLTTQHPMFIFWGHEHTCLYNDAYESIVKPRESKAEQRPENYLTGAARSPLVLVHKSLRRFKASCAQ